MTDRKFFFDFNFFPQLKKKIYFQNIDLGKQSSPLGEFQDSFIRGQLCEKSHLGHFRLSSFVISSQ